MTESIQAVAYETKNVSKWAVTLKGMVQPVTRGKGLIICADRSGSMHSMMGVEQDDNDIPASQDPWLPASPSLSHSRSRRSPYAIHPNSRLGCVKDFLHKITDMKEIASHGIMSTPALIIIDKLMVSGKIPTKATLLHWINEYNK